jgi:pimeloyl-ACP methyl ester carboxylesterase
MHRVATRQLIGMGGLAVRKCSTKSHAVKAYSSSYELKFLDIEDVDGSVAKVSYIDESKNESIPPLVVLGGTAQTINTFTPHIQGLRRHRRLIIVEMRGQGRTELDSSHCNMPQLITDLKIILKKLQLTEVHLCGFSFGGRVALTFAAKHPSMVKKLSITGVPLVRPALGKLIVQSWEDALHRDNFRECAWSFVLNGYSSDFINKHHAKLPTFLEFVMQSNDIKKLQNLIRLSHQNYGADYDLETCAQAIQCPTQIIAGLEDRIAGYPETVALAQSIVNSELVSLKTGHLIPFEDTTAWRTELLRFLDTTLTNN